jgi:hypothetical protein
MTLDPARLPIKAPSVTTRDQARKFASRAKGGAEYVDEVFALYPATGYSSEIVIAQWAVETGVGISPAWTGRYNPAGIGITDGGDLGYTWKTAADGARVQEVHLSAYVDGYVTGLRTYLDLDPRYLLVLKTAWATTVKTVQDLQGKWATDPQYATKIAGRIEELRSIQVAPISPDTDPDEPGDIVFGKVPRPAVKDRVIPDANNWAWDNLGRRSIYGIVYHRMIGTLWGTDGWFRGGGGGSGLTDYGIDNKNGEILKWNDPYGKGSAGVSPNRSGWASGGGGGISGDGVTFVSRYGRSAINRNLASLEIAGNYDSPVTKAGHDAIVQLSAHLADANRVPWSSYPTNPKTGLTFVYWHNEFQGEKPCPGQVIMDMTAQLIADTKELMKTFQSP